MSMYDPMVDLDHGVIVSKVSIYSIMTPWSTSWGHYIAIYILTLLTYLLYLLTYYT